MEQIENFLTPDSATDEPAVFPATPEADPHPPAWLYWQGVADGIRKCGGVIPPYVLEQAGLAPEPGARTDDGRDLLDFEAVPLRERSDGWTPAKQRQFVEELADCGILRRAAAAVGMTEQSVGRLRRRTDARAFDLACDAAQRIGARRLRSIAWERAVEGTVKQHFYHGELKSEERVYDNRLLIYLLGRTRHLDEPAPEAEQVLGNWDGWMQAIEQGLPEPSRPEPEAYAVDQGQDEFDGSEVWESEGEWWTGFPPPPDFDGIEHGEYRQLGYRRTLTDAERAVIEEDEADDLAEAEARRDRYFGLGETDDSFSVPAEPSETSELLAPLPAAGREGLGVGAAEALGGLQQDRLDDAVAIVEHVRIPEPDDGPPPPDEEARPRLVPHGPGMLPAVELDDEASPSTGEIHDIRRDRELPREPGPIEPEPLPQDTLAIGGVGPELTGP